MSQDGQFSMGYDGQNLMLLITTGNETTKVTFPNFDAADKVGDMIKDAVKQAREMAARATRPAILKG